MGRHRSAPFPGGLVGTARGGDDRRAHPARNAHDHRDLPIRAPPKRVHVMPPFASLLALLCSLQSRPADLREVFEFAVQGGAIHSVAWSPDGAWIASGGQEGDVTVWHAGRRAEAGRIRASDHWI